MHGIEKGAYDSCYPWADAVKTAAPLILSSLALSLPVSPIQYYLFFPFYTLFNHSSE